jgi:hypothetical protein
VNPITQTKSQRPPNTLSLSLSPIPETSLTAVPTKSTKRRQKAFSNL